MVYKKNSKKGKSVPSAHFTKLVKKVVQKEAEKKYSENQIASIAFDALPAAADICQALDVTMNVDITQGSNSEQRIGDRIKLVSMDFRAVFVPTVATTGAVRMIIGQVLDQSDPGVPTMPYSSVLTGLTGAADFSCITAAYDHEPLVSHRVLSDEVITWDATNAAAPRLIAHHFSNLPLRNRNYEGNLTTATGNFYYLFLSANGVAASLLRPYCKITYTDI